jgi:hypothetical protein
MDRRQIRRTGFAVGRPRHCVATLAAGVALLGVVCVPSASAGPLKEVVDTVGSTLRSAQEGVNATQSPPNTPAATPPSPVVTPAPPAQAPSKSPNAEPPASSVRSGTGPADLPPVDRIGGAAQRTVDSVAPVGSEAPNPPPTSERSDGRTAAAPQPRADRGASMATDHGSRTASSPPVAVRAAEVAALQRWLARIWPAVALGGSGASGTGVVEVDAGDLLRPALTAVTGLLLASSPVIPSSGDASLAGHQGVAGASRSATAPPPATAEDGGKIVYLIAIAGLLGLLAFTVWREFRLALHPGLR